jgi:hypothetical protein
METTNYGTVSWSTDSVEIHATRTMLYDWAHRPDASWPCSSLALCDEITARFDANGLFDLLGDGDDEIPADEFNAWSSDLLRDTLPKDHPCYTVTVGQFT